MLRVKTHKDTKSLSFLFVCLSVGLSLFNTCRSKQQMSNTMLESHYVVFYQPLFSFLQIIVVSFSRTPIVPSCYNLRFVFCSWKNWTTTIFSRSSERALNPELFAIWCSAVAVAPFRWVTSR